MKLSNKIVVITGASTGIGQTAAETFAKKNAKVILIARNDKKLSKIKDKIEKEGGQAKYYALDLRQQDRIKETVNTILMDIGVPDIIIHAAGVWHNDNTVFADTPIHLTPIEQINEVIEVSLLSGIILTKLFLPEMIKRKNGKIIFISGTFAYGGAGWLHYYVAKRGVENFTVGLADELRKYEIQVNCISPSDTKTEALKKFFPEDAETALEPIEVTKLCTYLASNEADNITGQTIVIKNKHVY